ncbi:hypothetical protein VKT23_009906 [Stygiomarasmius scandens]|uniref:Uncharacterized protein n=1 Tax=Marasmiellus scandens TaxID=2682957 RepID=A0ABR1JIX7_9AGAR
MSSYVTSVYASSSNPGSSPKPNKDNAKTNGKPSEMQTPPRRRATVSTRSPEPLVGPEVIVSSAEDATPSKCSRSHADLLQLRVLLMSPLLDPATRHKPTPSPRLSALVDRVVCRSSKGQQQY